MSTWERITVRARKDDGGTRKMTVTLEDPTVQTDAPGALPGTVVISGREVSKDGELTDRRHVILADAADVLARVELVQDLAYATLVPRDRESAESKAMRAETGQAAR